MELKLRILPDVVNGSYGIAQRLPEGPPLVVLWTYKDMDKLRGEYPKIVTAVSDHVFPIPVEILDSSGTCKILSEMIGNG